MLFSCYFNKHIKHELKNYENNKKKIYIYKKIIIYLFLFGVLRHVPNFV